MAEENKNVQSQDGVLMKYSMGKIILSFIYYNGLIRDTLEYVMKKPTYDVNFFKYKQNGILNEIKVNSPLKRFIDANGENGQKLLKKIEDFGDLVYGPSSTILKLADDGLRVDHAQHMAILEAVLPLHEELESIVLLHKKAALEKNELDDSINKLIDVDERFYRAVALLSLFLELRDQFGEFNKIMAENKGQRSAASNFVEKDIAKLVNLFNLTKQRATCTDVIYTNALDALSNLIEMMSGRRDLPKGLKWNEEMANVLKEINTFVGDAEPKFKQLYEPLVREMINDARKAREEQEKNKAQVNTEAKE